jgi:transcriptional regulator with XRE-family HTH domain
MVPAPKLKLMPGEAVRRWRDELGLTDRDLRGALDTDQRTLGRWVAGDAIPQREVRHRLALLMQLYDRLQETFDDQEIIREWLDSPSRYLGRMRPVDAIRAGCFAEAEAALEAFRSGAFI